LEELATERWRIAAKLMTERLWQFFGSSTTVPKVLIVLITEYAVPKEHSQWRAIVAPHFPMQMTSAAGSVAIRDREERSLWISSQSLGSGACRWAVQLDGV